MGGRVKRAKEAARLRAAGKTIGRIAAELGVSKTTVRRDLDPAARLSMNEGSKRWKRSQRGQCVDCGGTTTLRRLGGIASRCITCSRIHQAEEQRKWTPETITDAIRRFAEIHGRPPLSREWTAADQVNGFPCMSSVYRRDGESAAPYASWADAVEAAGFPRPHVGRFVRTAESQRRRVATAAENRKRKAERKAETFRAAQPQPVNVTAVPADVRRHVPKRPRGTSVGVQEMLATVDCQAYSCARDAEPGEVFCRRHLDVPSR